MTDTPDGAGGVPHPALVDGLLREGAGGFPITKPQGIDKVRYTHDGMIDMIVSTPMISQNELAAHFGYTPAWISTIMASDAFKAQLAMRRDKLVDPILVASIEERSQAMVSRSLEILQDKLAQPSLTVDPMVAIKAAELGAKILGMGGNAPQKTVVINAGDRLDGLAHRLTGLLRNSRKEVQDEKAQPVPYREENGTIIDVQGSFAGEGQPAEGTVRADGRIAGQPAQEDGGRRLMDLVPGEGG